MPDLLGKGMAWLADQRHQHMTRTVTYQRGGLTVDIAATPGRTEFDQPDEFGILHREQVRDFLVRAGDLVLAGAATLPEEGDRIRETDGDGKTYIYEVTPPGSGEPAWVWCGSYRNTLRIHTKHVGTEP